MRKKVVLLSLAALTFSTVAEASTLKDVSKHWGRSAIEWGVERGTVHGYPDGTFKPDKTVTEAEFLAMLIGSFEKVQPSKTGHWADPYYHIAIEKNYPTAGSTVDMIREWGISRGRVAEIMSGADGMNFRGEDAIKYMLGKGLAKGKNPKEISVASYEKDSYLTRAEAVQFIRTAMGKGLTELKVRPEQPSDPSLIPPLPQLETKPVPQQEQAGVPVLQQFNPATSKLSEADKKSLEWQLKMAIPRHQDTEKYVQQFLNSIKFTKDSVTYTIPELPNKYTASIAFGVEGMKEFKSSVTETHSIKGYQAFTFTIAEGVNGLNGVNVSLPMGDYVWITKR